MADNLSEISDKLSYPMNFVILLSPSGLSKIKVYEKTTRIITYLMPT